MYAEILTATGLTQKAMELFVLLGISVSVVGFLLVTYWRYILFGAFAIFCIVVLANQKTNDNTQPVVESAKIEQPQKAEEPKLDEDGLNFLEDCKAYTEYTDEQCKNLWFNRETVAGKQQKARILKAKYRLL